MTEDALNEMQHKVKQVKNLITFQIKYPTVFQKTTFFQKSEQNSEKQIPNSKSG